MPPGPVAAAPGSRDAVVAASVLPGPGVGVSVPPGPGATPETRDPVLAASGLPGPGVGVSVPPGPGATPETRDPVLAASVLAAPVAVAPASGGGHPELGLPSAVRGRRPPWWAVVVIAVVTGAVAGAISAPLVGLAAGVAVAAALVVPQIRAVTALVAVGLLAAGAATVVYGQIHHPLAESSNWPAAYQSAGVLVWMAVVFLGADAVVDAARRVAGRR